MMRPGGGRRRAGFHVQAIRFPRGFAQGIRSKRIDTASPVVLNFPPNSSLKEPYSYLAAIGILKLYIGQYFAACFGMQLD